MTRDEPAPSDKLTALEELLPRVRAAVEHKRLGEALREAVTVLRPFETHLGQLNSLTSSCEILVDYVQHFARQIEPILHEIDEIAQEMKEANSEHELKGLIADYPTLSQRLIPRFNHAVGSMAERYVYENIRSLGTLGRLLTKIGEIEIGERLEKLEKDAAELTHTAPSKLPPALESIERQRTARQAELKQLAGDPEVDEFLMALSRGQSSLRLVTPKVLDWLDQIEARDQFQVSSA